MISWKAWCRLLRFVESFFAKLMTQVYIRKNAYQCFQMFDKIIQNLEIKMSKLKQLQLKAFIQYTITVNIKELWKHRFHILPNTITD